MNSIFTRRSVRNFTKDVVEEEKIETLLKAAMQAPSACNQQAWEFIVVEGRENLDKLSTANPYSSSLQQATLAIIVLGNTQLMTAPDYWEQDLGAVTQNILLQATELNLGAVWYGTAPMKERMNSIKEMFQLPEHLPPYSVIGIGYPVDKDANHYIDRYDASKVRRIKS